MYNMLLKQNNKYMLDTFFNSFSWSNQTNIKLNQIYISDEF